MGFKYIKLLEYKGHQIVYYNWKNLSGKEYEKAIATNFHDIGHSDIRNYLLIVDVTGSAISNKVLWLMKDLGKKQKPLIKKTAVLGVVGIKKVLLNYLNQFSDLNSKPFDDIEAAKEYLISDEE